MRKLTKEEEKVIALLKKADELSKSPNVNLSIFGNAGYSFYVLDNTTKYLDFEIKNSCIANERVFFTSKNIKGDGGDSYFEDAEN